MAERRRKVTIEQIEQALIANGGWFTKAANALGVSHQAVSKRVAKSERLQKAVEEVKAKYLDLAESKLLQKINEGDLGAICFYLKCQGRQRGYIEKAKIDANVTMQEPMVIQKDEGNADD
jgi:predicted transcriptional regulator